MATHFTGVPRFAPGAKSAIASITSALSLTVPSIRIAAVFVLPRWNTWQETGDDRDREALASSARRVPEYPRQLTSPSNIAILMNRLYCGTPASWGAPVSCRAVFCALSVIGVFIYSIDKFSSSDDFDSFPEEASGRMPDAAGGTPALPTIILAAY